MNDNSLVYIGGYGRSGSTLLGIVLGNHERFVHVGELQNIVQPSRKESLPCSCGKSCSDCEFWAEVSASAALEAESATKYIESHFRRPLFLVPKSALATYRSYWQSVFDDIAARTGGKIPIDGSKSAYAAAWRALSINRILGREVYFIHLVRDPRDVILSKIKGNNNLLAKGDTRAERGASVIGLVGWLLANWYALRTASKLGPNRAFILRYERFLDDPETALAGLGRFLGVNLDGELQTILAGLPFPTGHIIAGNRMSSRKEVVMRRQTVNRDTLKFRHKLMCLILARPMDMYIGKKLKDQARRLQRTAE